MSIPAMSAMRSGHCWNPLSLIPQLRRREATALARRSYLNAMRHLFTVHDTFTRWTRHGLWERVNTALREQRRVELKKAPPSAAIIDSQSLKCADTVAAGSSGYDAGKKTTQAAWHLHNSLLWTFSGQGSQAVGR